MTLRVCLFRWLLANAVLAGITFLCAGSVRLPTLRVYLVAFAAVGLVSTLTVKPDLAKERSQPAAEGIDPAIRHGASTLFMATVAFGALDVGRLNGAFPFSTRSTERGPCRIYRSQRSSNLGDGRERLLFDGTSSSARAGPASGHQWPISFRSASRVPGHAVHRSFHGPYTWLDPRPFSRIGLRGAHFVLGPHAKTRTSSKIFPVMPIISEGFATA